MSDRPGSRADRWCGAGDAGAGRWARSSRDGGRDAGRQAERREAGADPRAGALKGQPRQGQRAQGSQGRLPMPAVHEDPASGRPGRAPRRRAGRGGPDHGAAARGPAQARAPHGRGPGWPGARGGHAAQAGRLKHDLCAQLGRCGPDSRGAAAAMLELRQVQAPPRLRGAGRALVLRAELRGLRPRAQARAGVAARAPGQGAGG